MVDARTKLDIIYQEAMGDVHEILDRIIGAERCYFAAQVRVLNYPFGRLFFRRLGHGQKRKEDKVKPCHGGHAPASVLFF